MTIFSTHPLQGLIKPVPDVRVRHFTEAGVLTTFQCLEAREERLKVYIERIDSRTSTKTGNSNENMLISLLVREWASTIWLWKKNYQNYKYINITTYQTLFRTYCSTYVAYALATLLPHSCTEYVPRLIRLTAKIKQSISHTLQGVQ